MSMRFAGTKGADGAKGSLSKDGKTGDSNGGHPGEEKENVIAGPGTRPGRIGSDFEQAVGLERLELLSELAGRPLYTSTQAGLEHGGGPTVRGTLSDPVIVETVDGSGAGRLVGCTGHPRGTHELGFFWVRSERDATRCPECGQAFKLRVL
jgi:cytochrome c oxidase subunit 5b